MDEDAKTNVSTYVTPVVISAVGITCSILAIAVYHCILLRYFVRPLRTQQRWNNDVVHNTDTRIIKNDNKEGVQEEILNKIPVFSISRTTTTTTTSDDLVDQNECSICLGQWEDGDLVRLLPSCNHAFHRTCIDAWFMSHTNCPVCRSPITCLDCDDQLPLPLENNINVGGNNEQIRVLHVLHGNMNISVPSDGVGGCSSPTPRFQRPLRRPRLLHTHSLSSHMQRKPRGLVLMGLKRSLSLDQTSSYIAIAIPKGS